RRAGRQRDESLLLCRVQALSRRFGPARPFAGGEVRARTPVGAGSGLHRAAVPGHHGAGASGGPRDFRRRAAPVRYPRAHRGRRRGGRPGLSRIADRLARASHVGCGLGDVPSVVARKRIGRSANTQPERGSAFGLASRIPGTETNMRPRHVMLVIALALPMAMPAWARDDAPGAAPANNASLTHSALKATTFKVGSTVTNLAVLSVATGGVAGGAALATFMLASSWVIYTANDYAWDTYSPPPRKQT